jgi:hypothetical protein
MKKLATLVILALLVLIVKAGNETSSYVSAGGETYFGQKVKTGLFAMSLTMNDGTVLRIPLKKVDSYSGNGRLFERMPVRCNGVETNCTAMMEYITSRNGFRLYKHCECGEQGDLWDNTYKKAHMQFEFYVYKDGKFYLPVNQENATSVLPFFGIEVF